MIVRISLLTTFVSTLLLATATTRCHAAQYRTKVAILGAGAAGISAASRLSQKNETDFMIIEAQSFIGGRVQHQPFGDYSVELGANWIYGKGANPIYRLAVRHGLATTPNDKRDVVYFDAYGPTSTEMGHKTTEDFEQVMEDMKRLSKNQVDLSSRTALRLLGWEPDTPLKSAVEYFAIDWELAEPAEVASLDYATGTTDMTVGTFPFGNEFVVDHRGFNFILRKEADMFLEEEDERLLLNTMVTQVDYSQATTDADGLVRVTTNNGHEIIGDYVLCTFSLGVLQSNTVQFIPELPEWKKEALFSFHMTTYTKIFVKFDHQFWGDWQFALYADTNGTKPDSGYTVWQNLNAPGYFSAQNSDEKRRDNILMVTTTYKDSERIERMSDTEIIEEITAVLQRMFPDFTVPRPLEILVPRWHSNPLFRGSYSNWPIGMQTQHHDNIRAPLPADSKKPKVVFPGEAYSQDYYGYLHGAWLEGSSTADSILECMDDECTPQPFFDGITGCSWEPTFKFRKSDHSAAANIVLHKQS
ncbi:hypothetical protein BDB00DRAFT_773571 [Zychaea mexicana]|uniref:uncharacterized protein n=1 Tax=Zychaea mexicana TaxID=64656 RepID=UPI0022FDCB94|nr:uncharacterized protein BDB00DRAFT_773571 [Zychaea mexicana]KAI9487922.1 hypothetical protein BDB00DRAFT_773571 [Zychaea mexicana]